MIVVIVFWKERKNRRCAKPEEAYYSTIDEIKLQGVTKSKPEVVDTEMSKEQPQYMEISENVYSTPEKVALQLQNNPSYSVKITDSLAYAISREDQTTIQAYAISCEDQTTVQAYAIH